MPGLVSGAPAKPLAVASIRFDWVWLVTLALLGLFWIAVLLLAAELGRAL